MPTSTTARLRFKPWEAPIADLSAAPASIGGGLDEGEVAMAIMPDGSRKLMRRPDGNPSGALIPLTASDFDVVDLQTRMTNVEAAATAHLVDAVDAHDATAISTTVITQSPVSVAAGTAQSAIADTVTALNDHLNDAVDAHDASAISTTVLTVAPVTVPAGTAQSALAATVTALAGHLNNAAGAHAASAISTTVLTVAPVTVPAGTAQSALAATVTALAAHINDTSNAHMASSIGANDGFSIAGGGVQTVDNMLNALAMYADRAAGRNTLINSGFKAWQRGDTFTIPSGASAGTFTARKYTADRWYAAVKSTAGAGTISVAITRNDDPSDLANPLSPRGMTVEVTVTSGTGTLVIVQELDPLLVKALRGKWVTLTQRASPIDVGTAPTITQGIGYSATPGSHYANGASVGMALLDSQAISADGVTRDNLAIQVPVDAECLAAVYIVEGNAAAVSGTSFVLGEVMLSPSPTGTYGNTEWSPYNGSPEADFEACESYFQKSHEPDQAPTTPGGGLFTNHAVTFATSDIITIGQPPTFRRRMRAIPTVKLYSPLGVADVWTFGGGNVAVTAANVSTIGCALQAGAGYAGAGRSASGHWTADAEI